MTGQIKIIQNKLCVSPEHGGNNLGYFYKNEDAFEKKSKVMPCYVSEYAFDGIEPFLTESDGTPWFDCDEIKDSKGNFLYETYFSIKELAEEYLKTRTRFPSDEQLEGLTSFLFEMVDWQFVSTLIDELDNDIVEIENEIDSLIETRVKLAFYFQGDLEDDQVTEIIKNLIKREPKTSFEIYETEKENTI
jgi:hypothetical protein